LERRCGLRPARRRRHGTSGSSNLNPQDARTYNPTPTLWK
jgi:hypothetical protein